MSAETKKVLEMLAAGKISPEDAERLLNKLSASGASDPAASKAIVESRATDTTGSTTGTKKPRFLRIQVERAGKKDVNIRVPLPFALAGQLVSFLPASITEKLRDHGVGVGIINAMKSGDFPKSLDDMNIDIESGDGEKVRIYAE